MTDTTVTNTGPAAPKAPSNYILFRTAPYPSADRPVHPAGYVIINQMLSETTGLKSPAGTAYVADPDGKYPVSSIYTPPADTTITELPTAPTT